MEEQMYCVCLCEFFSDRTVAESDRMSYEEAKKAKEYLDLLFPNSVYATIEPAD